MDLAGARWKTGKQRQTTVSSCNLYIIYIIAQYTILIPGFSHSQEIFLNDTFKWISHTLEMGYPHQLNQNLDAQHGLTQVSSPFSNSDSMRLMFAWLCYPLSQHAKVPPDKEPFWFITALQDATKEVPGWGCQEARDKFNTLLLKTSAPGFHLVMSLGTTDVGICLIFLQVLLCTRSAVLHRLSTIQCFRSRREPREI